MTMHAAKTGPAPQCQVCEVNLFEAPHKEWCASGRPSQDKPENFSPHTKVSDFWATCTCLKDWQVTCPVHPFREEINYSNFEWPAATTLPTDAAERKNIPIATGVLDYFPAAIAEVAHVSFVGNEKHNPGQDLHHARGKSMDHADCIARHLVERGTIDTVKLPDGREFKVRHSAYVAWRALALLQEELEAAGAPMARGAR